MVTTRERIRGGLGKKKSLKQLRIDRELSNQKEFHLRNTREARRTGEENCPKQWQSCLFMLNDSMLNAVTQPKFVFELNYSAKLENNIQQ